MLLAIEMTWPSYASANGDCFSKDLTVVCSYLRRLYMLFFFPCVTVIGNVDLHDGGLYKQKYGVINVLMSFNIFFFHGSKGQFHQITLLQYHFVLVSMLLQFQTLPRAMCVPTEIVRKRGYSYVMYSPFVCTCHLPLHCWCRWFQLYY